MFYLSSIHWLCKRHCSLSGFAILAVYIFHHFYIRGVEIAQTQKIWRVGIRTHTHSKTIHFVNLGKFVFQEDRFIHGLDFVRRSIQFLGSYPILCSLQGSPLHSASHKSGKARQLGLCSYTWSRETSNLSALACSFYASRRKSRIN